MTEAQKSLRRWMKEQGIDDIIPSANAEEHEDCISREAVLDLCSSKDAEYRVCHLKEDVECLPSVQPQQSTGHWIESYIPESTLCECSACGFTCGAYSFNYCPNCGAKMAESEDRDDKA